MTGDDPDTRPTGQRPPDTLRPQPGETAGHGVDATPTRAAEAVPPPAYIGPYRILKTIGRGGMGTVYLARDDQHDRDVALKVIPAGPDADPTDLARFRAEAEAVARLDHPNIVRLYEVGEGEGVAWLAMEYVGGGNLYKRVTRDGPLPPAEAARLVEQVARAIHYAHTRGVVHRDLKPSNILLAGHDVPKVADFGLAKQLDHALRLTQSGIAVGTPHYMAPEQARGLNEQVGPPADIYALGAILYELLTGHPPFKAPSALETMEQVVHRKPVPPTHLRSGIPPGLEAICLKCLEKSPARRFRTAEALADALRNYLEGPPDTSRPQGYPAVRTGVWWYRLAAVAAAGLVLALLAGTATWVLVARSHRADVRAVEERAEAAARAERRARLEAAIALCERGQVALGLDRMRALEGDEALPVHELAAAWEARVLRRTPRQPSLPATVAALSPRGDRLATAAGKALHIWKTDDWSADGDVWPVEADVTALAWADDGRSLVLGTGDGRILRGTVEGRELAKEPLVKDLGRPVAAVAWAGPGVRYTLAGDALPRGETGPDQPVGPVTATAPSSETGDVAAVLDNGAVRIYDAGDRRWRDLPPDGDASAVAYSSDGNVLAVGTRAGTVRLWDAVSRTPFTDAISVGQPVTALSVAAVGREYLVIACPQDGPAVALRCGRPFHASPIRLAGRPGEEVLGVAFTPHKTGLYVTSPAGVSLWRYGEGGRYVRERDFHSGPRYPKADAAGAFTACSVCGATEEEPGSLLIGGAAGRVFHVDAENDRDLTTADVPGAERVSAVAVGPDGRRVCVCGRAKGRKSLLRHWANGLTAEPCDACELDVGVNHQAFLPDGSALVLGCDDGKVRLWDPAAGKEVRPPLDCRSPVLAVAVSNDGQRVLAGCADGAARLWDLGFGVLLVTVRHRAEVRGVAFHKDDLLTASADGTARRWHPGTGLPLGPPLPHADAVTALAVWRDLAATGGRDRRVRVWRLN